MATTDPRMALLDVASAIDAWRAQVRAALARSARTSTPLTTAEARDLLAACPTLRNTPPQV